jgi:hypothetical protein
VRVLVMAMLSASVLLRARSAAAFEDEWHLGGGVGFASLPATDYTTGVALGVHAAYGISDMFDLRLELLGSRHTFPVVDAAEAPAALLLSAAAGPAYKLDVGDWIPYGAFLVGYYAFAGNAPSVLGLEAPADEAAGTSFALGVDYGPLPHLGFGLQARFHGIFDELPSSLEQTAYFSLLLRAEWRFGR